MRKTSLFRELLIVENAPPGGGVPRVTLPSEPVLPAQIATPPAPILPTPGATIMNGGGHGTDEFQFDQMFLGTPPPARRRRWSCWDSGPSAATVPR